MPELEHYLRRYINTTPQAKEQSPSEEPFDVFVASQPLNRRPKLVYEPSVDLVDKDETKSSMNRYKKKNQYHLVECPLQVRNPCII